MPGAWVGYSGARLKLDVPNKMSDEMVARYEKVEKALADPRLDVKERLGILAKIAGEQHYFAARFVSKIWKEAKDLAIKSAALGHTVSLLEFGTAYESFDEMMDVLVQEDQPEDIRHRILTLLGRVLLYSNHPGFIVAKQAYWELSESSQKKAHDAIKKLSEGPDPALSIEARKILAQPKAAPIKAALPATKKAEKAMTKPPPGQP